jgi:dTDP-L-rhamnose 4-epimerase
MYKDFLTYKNLRANSNTANTANKSKSAKTHKTNKTYLAPNRGAYNNCTRKLSQNAILPTVALRYFNVYGSRQALSNPYTRCAAIFTSRILNNKPPYIFEDGNQTRDFIHVKDVAKANLNALEHKNANYQAINIGTGKPLSIAR